MRVKNLINNGKGLANQFIIEDGNKVAFQSYDSLICEIENNTITFTQYHNFSRTTIRYRNMFLSDFFNETLKSKDIEKMISLKEYKGYKVAVLN